MLPPILLLLCVTISQLCSGTFATPINETSPIEIRAPGSFVHPGILIDLEQLEFIRTKVKAKIEPWNTAYNNLRWSEFGDLKRRAHPHTYVDCGFYNIGAKVGCQDEVHDALAAYATSLLWYVTGQAKYAQKSISYMNSWARVIKAHRNKNERIQAGWAAASWTRAAEIIRHTSHHWASKDIQRFEDMLRHAYLPSIRRGAPPKYNGNWGLVLTEAAQGIAIFLDDHELYHETMTKFSTRVPAYIYLRTDGKTPKVDPMDRIHSPQQIHTYWNGQTVFPTDGISQETCRDFAHTGSGLSSIAHVAETSRIQGQDLYLGDVGTRLYHALEFHSQIELHGHRGDWLCRGNKLKRGLPPMTEIGFNNLELGVGKNMPHTRALTKKNRPAYTNFLDLGFETLSHAKSHL